MVVFDERDGCRAESYSTCDPWLAELAGRAGHRKEAEGPFWAIEFADNERYTGPVVAAKLARNFAEGKGHPPGPQPDRPRTTVLGHWTRRSGWHRFCISVV